MVTVSDRWIWPVPVLPLELLIEISLLGSIGTCASRFSRPNRLGMPAASVLLRVAVEEFCTFAESAMLTRIVTKSPTRAARWSLKKARAPGRQSDSLSAGAGWGAGIGMVTGCQPGVRVGSWTGASAGGRPTSDRR